MRKTRTRWGRTCVECPSVRILVLEDDAGLRRGIERHLKRSGAEVTATASIEEAIETLRTAPGFDAFVTDLHLPDGTGLEVLERLPAEAKRPATIVMTGEATIETAVGALRLGALDYLLKPFSMEALDTTLRRVVAHEASPEPRGAPDFAAAEAWRARHAPQFLGRAPRLLEVFEVLRRVAPTDCSVLVSGETGTGKELVARAIHAASGRGGGPFVAINCASVPEQLMESELFGHAKGAYTGAQSARVGRFQAAHQGTLFLDEVGEMPLALQAKLLRALQEKEILPLGENHPVHVDVRVVAATHRDLEAMVEARQFREDLLYRLDVIRVELPPLRSRAGDIELLVQAFVRDACARRGANVTLLEPAALEALRAYAWPGNVRQLQNVVERMVLLRGDGAVTLADVPEKIRGAAASRAASAHPYATPMLPDEGIDLRDAVERFETALILQALERVGGNRNRAAALLKLNRTTLVEKLKKREISQPDAPRPGEE
jgi:DNA-binding NtrC family response regulator